MVTWPAVVQGDRRPLLAENGSINAQQDEVDMTQEEEEVSYTAENGDKCATSVKPSVSFEMQALYNRLPL